MSVGHGGHGIDLEILVGSDNGNSLDWSPVGEGWLSIVEPLVADVLDVVVINVRNSLGNLGSWESSAKLEHVLTNVVVHGLWGLGGKEFVVKVVSTSDNLDVVEIMRVDGWKTNSAVVHLSCEYLISEEVVTEKTGITVRHVVAFSSSDIWKISEESVHRVVLLVAVVEMLGMLINSVRTEHVLQEKETVVVLVLDTWGIVEDTNVTVVHLIVSDEEDSWDINGFIGVLSGNSCELWEGGEVLLNGIDDGLVGNITGGDDNHVVTVVVGGVVFSEVVSSQSGGHISITLDWLSKHVLSVGVEMSVFESGLFEPVVVVLMLHADLILDELKLGRVKGIVGKHISEKADCFASISLEDLKAVVGLLSIGLGRVSRRPTALPASPLRT